MGHTCTYSVISKNFVIQNLQLSLTRYSFLCIHCMHVQIVHVYLELVVLMFNPFIFEFIFEIRV